MIYKIILAGLVLFSQIAFANPVDYFISGSPDELGEQKFATFILKFDSKQKRLIKVREISTSSEGALSIRIYKSAGYSVVTSKTASGEIRADLIDLKNPLKKNRVFFSSLDIGHIFLIHQPEHIAFFTRIKYDPDLKKWVVEAKNLENASLDFHAEDQKYAQISNFCFGFEYQNSRERLAALSKKNNKIFFNGLAGRIILDLSKDLIAEMVEGASYEIFAIAGDRYIIRQEPTQNHPTPENTIFLFSISSGAWKKIYLDSPELQAVIEGDYLIFGNRSGNPVKLSWIDIPGWGIPAVERLPFGYQKRNGEISVRTMDGIIVDKFRVNSPDYDILAVDGKVLYYRVDASIFRRELGSGKDNPELLVMDKKYVPTIHWAF